MNNPANVLDVYKDLAECYERRGQAQMRDRFLVLAADAALTGGNAGEAERLRLRLLQVNPHHMLKPYSSFDQARTAPDVDTYIRNLRLNYPLEVAADLMRALHASDDPGVQALQQTAQVPAPAVPIEPTLNIDSTDDRSAPTAWLPSAESLEQTSALPSPAPPAPARPAQWQANLAETAHIPGAAPPRPPRRHDDVAATANVPSPAMPRPRVPTKAEPEQVPRPSSSRAVPAPRSPAPSSAPPRPAVPSKPTVPKAPPRPAPGPSPFASLPNEPAPANAPLRSRQSEAPPEDSGWLAWVLVFFVVILGAGALGYTIARPFLPKEWLP